MPRPLKLIETSDPIGLKINQVMAEKGIAADYKALADAFGVTAPSAREWVQFGRIAKDRYPQLVAWSGRSLHWWFDVPEPGGNTLPARESSPPAYVRPAPALPAPEWPFPTIEAARIQKLLKRLGQAQGKTAMAELERHLDLLLTDWERKADSANRRAA